MKEEIVMQPAYIDEEFKHMCYVYQPWPEWTMTTLTYGMFRAFLWGGIAGDDDDDSFEK